MSDFRRSEYLCTSEVTLGLISGKWKILILSHLAERTLRFNELQKLMPGATQKVLTMQLKDLERDGLVIRTVHPVSPPKVEYSLADLGRRAIPLLKQLCDYGAYYMDSNRSADERTERLRSRAGASPT